MSRPLRESQTFSFPTPSPFKVLAVPVFETNYAYIIVDDSTQKAAALVDPAEPEKVLKWASGLDIECLLLTHHHSDHTGGNCLLAQKYPSAKVCGFDERIPGLNTSVSDRQSIRLGSLRIEALHTPCHTSGSLSWVVHDDTASPSAQAVFTGDTLFLAGCGYFFEGTAEDMYRSLGVLAKLPKAVKVFVGHEYTLNNLEFAMSIEPNNAATRRRYERLILEKSAKGFVCTVPGTIEEELETNPFMRVEIEGSDPVEAMHRIREAKNNFNKAMNI